MIILREPQQKQFTSVRGAKKLVKTVTNAMSKGNISNRLSNHARKLGTSRQALLPNEETMRKISNISPKGFKLNELRKWGAVAPGENAKGYLKNGLSQVKKAMVDSTEQVKKEGINATRSRMRRMQQML